MGATRCRTESEKPDGAAREMAERRKPASSDVCPRFGDHSPSHSPAAQASAPSADTEEDPPQDLVAGTMPGDPRTRQGHLLPPGEATMTGLSYESNGIGRLLQEY